MLALTKTLPLENESSLHSISNKALDFQKRELRRSSQLTQHSIFDQKPNLNDHIFIKQDKSLVRVYFNDILYCEKVGDYVSICTVESKFLVLKGINTLLDKLNFNCLIKVHRSYIVNKNKIEGIEDHSLHIGSKIIPISRALKADVLNNLNIL